MKNWLPILAIASSPCLAQQDSTSAHFREFENKIATQVFLLNNSNNFTIASENDAVAVELVPNNKTTLNLGFQYDIISFSIGFAPRFLSENENKQGSRMRSLSFEFLPGRWMQRLEYHNQKGLTIREVGATEGLYLEHLRSTKIGGTTNFFFNRKFSYRAISLQNVQQLRSAGSFSVGLAYHYTELDGREEMLLQDKINFFDIAFTPAYHYNWVIGKYVNLAGGISIGAGINFTNDAGEKSSSELYTSSLLLAPGFNSDRWFFGANLRANYAYKKVGSGVDVGDTMSYSTLFVGYRFEAPQFLTKKTQQIKRKFIKEKN